MTSSWTEHAIASQHGKTCVITGGHKGLGLEVVRMLTTAGAHVIIVSRDTDRATQSISDLPHLDRVSIVEGDLSSQQSVTRCARVIADITTVVDVLIHNAGIMNVPKALSVDGHEIQFATNYLGHFTLTALLWPLITAGEDPRVISVTSIAHKAGKIRPDSFCSTNLNPRDSYSQSKLANLMFAYELDRKLTQISSPVKAVAVHPGVSATDLFDATFDRPILKLVKPYALGIMRDSSSAALSMVMAATDPDISSGRLYGPGSLFGSSRQPCLENSSAYSQQEDIAQELWTSSEQLTGHKFPF